MLGSFERALDELMEATAEPASLADGELHDLVIASQRAESQFAAVRARLLAEWDSRRTWADNGSKSATMRLARECRCSTATAGRELKRARKLRSMPHTTAAVQTGKLSMDQADLLGRVNQPAVATAFARDEGLLVDQCMTLGFGDCKRITTYWLHQTHDELDVAPSDAALEGRHFDAARTMYDSVSLMGMLDAVGGTIVLDELQRLEQHLFEADWKAARDQHGLAATPDQLARTATQRRADALVEMARRSACLVSAPTTTRPLITVLAGYGAFSNMCELADGTVVTPAQVMPLLRDADIERIVFDGPSRVIEVGARRRFFSGALRRAIEVRDRHCQHPSGCDVRAERCEIDHIVPYARGGLTTLDNGRCYCKVHNRQRVGHEVDEDESLDTGPDPPDDG